MECGPHTPGPWAYYSSIPLSPYENLADGITVHCFMGILDYAMELQICDS
jgi:hypothetical protein